jgi:hypothetical protein
VQNGVVVLQDGVSLPEGQEVTVVSQPKAQQVQGHSVLDIPTVSVGAILRPLTRDDDILGEMLEGRS